MTRAWRRWPELAALAAPVLLVLVMLGPGLLGLQLFGAGDLIEDRAPWRETSQVQTILNACISDTVDSRLATMVAFQDRLAAGDLAPLWDASVSSGMMLAGSASQGVTSPIYLAAMLAPAAAAPAWMKLLEIVTVLVGTVLWGRRIGLSRAAGVLAGLVFATSGFMVMWTNWPHTRTAAFFPLLFWAVERIVQERTVRSALPLVLAGVGLALGGFPAVAVHGVYAAAAYALVRLLVANRGQARRAAGWLRPLGLAALAGVLVVGLVAFQLLPWVQFLGSVDLAYRADFWSSTFGLREVLTTAYPQALGTCFSEDLRWGSVIPVEGVSFIGAGALVLCLAAVVLPAGGRMRGVRPFLVGLGGLALAATFLGGPINYVLQLLPLMGDSGLHRLRGIGGLAFAMLAAVGFDAVRRSAGTRRPLAWAGVVLAPLVLAAMALGVWLVAPTEQHWAQARASVWLGLAAAVLVAAVWAWRMSGLRGGALAVAVVVPAVLLAEGLAFTAAYWPRTDPELLYRDTATTQYLQENLGTERMVGVHGAYWVGAGKTAGLRSLSGHLFVPEEWQDLLETADPNMFNGPTVHSLSSLGLLESPALDRLAVAYAVADTTVIPVGDYWGAGEQDPTRTYDLHEAAGTRQVPAGTALRAAFVQLTEPAEVTGEATFEVAVVGPDGQTLATGSRRVREGEEGLRSIPLVAEHVARTGLEYQVRVHVEGAAEVTVAGGGPSGPWVGVMVAGEQDTLNLVHAEDAQVYERTTVLPRYRWAGSAAPCTGAQDCAALMAEVPASTVLLSPADQERVAMSGAGAEVTVLADGHDHRRVQVRAEGDGMLVVADGYHDGWHASVDGEEVGILRADHAMRGVPVPAGDHEVELWYEPPGWPALPALAGVTALATLALWVALAVRDRRAAGRRTVRSGPPARSARP